MPEAVWSRHFNAFQLQSLARIGEVYLPAHAGLPGFAETGCLAHVDIVLDEVHPEDRRALGWLLYWLRPLPLVVLRAFVGMLDQHPRYPEPLAGGLRLLNLALKGVVMSLYYSGMTHAGSQVPDPLTILEYAPHCEPDGP